LEIASFPIVIGAQESRGSTLIENYKPATLIRILTHQYAKRVHH